jgi:hypothetical protein
MKFFPYKKKNLDKTELQFIIATMIEAAVSQIESITSDTNIPGENELQLIRIAQESLGWNLSILYAQTIGMNEGMGVADALEIVELGERVEQYGQDYYESGTREKIDLLVEDWYKEVYKTPR